MLACSARTLAGESWYPEITLAGSLASRLPVAVVWTSTRCFRIPAAQLVLDQKYRGTCHSSSHLADQMQYMDQGLGTHAFVLESGRYHDKLLLSMAR